MSKARELLTVCEAMSYTVYKVEMNGKLSHKEHLNDLDELNTWLADNINRFANILIIQDQTNKKKYMTSVGGEWVERGK